MAHDETVFNGNNFIENLDLVLIKNTDESISLSPTNGTPVDIPSGNYIYDTYNDNSLGNPDSFFQRFSQAFEPLKSLENFTNFWELHTGGVGLKEDLREKLFEDYQERVGDLGDTIPTIGTPDLEQQFENAFNHFVVNYPYIYFEGEGDFGDFGQAGHLTTYVDEGINGYAPDPGAAENFLRNWSDFIARTADITDANSTPDLFLVENGTTTILNLTITNYESGSIDLAAYEHIYNGYGFDPAGFANRVQIFYNEKLLETGQNNAENGWFIPSHHFHEWFEEMHADYLAQHDISSITTTVSSDSAKDLLVIDRILRLLIEMVGVLQRISASQAQRLTFLTVWQQAYTELLIDIPTFTQGDGSPIDGTTIVDGSGSAEDQKKSQREYRNSATTEMQALTERVRARRSAVQDEAKQLQTTINQSQDAGNQQAQMGTALLQQLATILSQIFR